MCFLGGPTEGFGFDGFGLYKLLSLYFAFLLEGAVYRDPYWGDIGAYI